jgi:methylglutaconyl-CoA hydratase
MGVITATADANGVLTLRLENERRRNALDDAMLEVLSQVAETAAEAAPRVRLIVVRGAGGTFCAGRDVSDLSGDANSSAVDRIAPAGRLADAIRHCPVPTLAVVEGKAVGLGVALVAWCDLAMATEDATFAIPEARIGVPPSLTAISLLHTIGRRNTAFFALTGRPVTAQEAMASGLVHRICPADGIDEALSAVASDVLRGSPSALFQTKALLRQAEGLGFRDGIEKACTLARASLSSADQREGIAAFRDRRPPIWS